MLQEIFSRLTTRSFKDEMLDFRNFDRIQKILERVIVFPFEPLVRARWVELNHEFRQLILSHADYGTIKGKPQILVFSCRMEPRALMNLGYYLSYVTLEVTKLGIASAILGGSFKESLLPSMSFKEHEEVPVILCVGRPDKKEKERRRSEKKSFSEIHFQRSLDYSITQDIAPYLKTAMEAMLHSPSHQNSQPWRTIIQDKTLHFYLSTTDHLEEEIHYIDMGLALHHLMVQLKSQGIRVTLANLPREKVRNAQYIISVVTREPEEA